ncbi:hypothetical protein MMC18_003851 [Xylographa bjoerkii]|nr:hypothetical protein [Xylographa bjoerkii]
MSYSPIEDNFTTSYKYIDLMEKGQAFPADLIHPKTRLNITEHCREVRQASTRVLSNTHASVVGGPQPILHRGYVDFAGDVLPNPTGASLTSDRTSALGVHHSPVTNATEAVLPNNNVGDNENNIHTADREQRTFVSAEYRASIAALFATLYPGYIADYHAQNSSDSHNHEHIEHSEENLHRRQTPIIETVDWPSPTVSEFLRVPSPSTSWIDIDEHSDGRSSASADQEELPEVPYLSLGSPLLSVQICGLFNIHEGSRVVKAPFRHRIPERASSFENLQCGSGHLNPRSNYLRTLGSDGYLSYVPFSPATKIQYAEPGRLTSEELVALNQDSPLVLRVKRVREKEDQKLFRHRAAPRWNGLSGLEEVRSWCNVADTTVPPPNFSELALSQMEANLTRLRSELAQLKSDMADEQHYRADDTEHFASEQDNTIHSTAPLADLGCRYPSLHRENATLGHISIDAVYRPRRMGLTPNDRRCDGTVFDETFRINSLLQCAGYDRDNVELGNAPIDELCHPCHMGLSPDNHRADSVAINADFHVESLLESPVYDHGHVGIRDASITAAYHPCHMGSTIIDYRDNDIVRSGSFHTESLSQSPCRTSDMAELGHAEIGKVYRPRRVGLTPNDNRRNGVIFDKDFHVECRSQSPIAKQQNAELAHASIYDTAISPYGTEHHWADYNFNNESQGANPHDLVVPRAPRPRNSELAKRIKHNDTQPLPLEPEDSMLSENSTGTVVVHRLRRRRGIIFDASMKIESRSISASSSTTLWDVSLDSPTDPARIAYNRDLTLAMLERRVDKKEFGSPMKQSVDPEGYYRNDSGMPVPDRRILNEAEVAKPSAIAAKTEKTLAQGLHGCDMAGPANSPPIGAGTQDSPTQTRLSVQWVDQVPQIAAARPLALEIPANTQANQYSDDLRIKIASSSSSKAHRSATTWFRDKVKKLPRFFH